MEARDLPVYQQRDRILDALKDHQVVVVESPTGSGKTTQIPIILHEAGYTQRGIVGITQPRRIAAVSVSQYIARQLKRDDGFAAYKMRFDDQTTPETRLKVMTDGILLQEMKGNDLLPGYSVMMVDEAHERSLNIDFVIGLLKRLLEMRPDFRVIVSSATINAEIFSEYFNGCPVVRIDTMSYPVDVRYKPPKLRDNPEEMNAHIVRLIEAHVREGVGGDVLVFLSGERVIKDCVTQLYGSEVHEQLHILPLYGRLSKEEQDSVFPPAPPGKTKVVVATNIAETSITIDGITAVFDPGMAKLNFYNPRTYTSALIEQPISKAAANQRKGRAGRTRPGVCTRLYTQEEFERRPLFTTEEIYRTDLSEVVLRMAELGIRDFESFDFISSPGARAIAGAVDTLRLLGALDEERELTDIGRMMTEFPLIPRHSRIIVEAIREYPEVIDEVLTAASFLTTNSPFLLPQGEELEARRAHHSFRDDFGDFISYLKMLDAYQRAKKRDAFCERLYLDPRVMSEINGVKEQLSEIVTNLGVPIGYGGSIADYLTAVATGLVQFVCVADGRGVYQSLTAQQIRIHPESGMFRRDPEFIVAGEIVRTSRMYARSVSPLDPAWLPRISPQLKPMVYGPPSTPSGGRGEPRRKEGKRDTSMTVTIGVRVFPLQRGKKGKKVARIPWDQLKRELDAERVHVHPQFRELRGVLLVGDRELMPGERLSTILRAAPLIDPTERVTDYGAKRSYDVYSERPTICRLLSEILAVTRLRKSGNALGFLTLRTDNQGRYWFRPTKRFSVAVVDSLGALESLVDDISEDTEGVCVDAVNATYRRLNDALAQM